MKSKLERAIEELKQPVEGIPYTVERYLTAYGWVTRLHADPEAAHRAAVAYAEKCLAERED